MLEHAWWVWVLILFIFTFFLGVLAVMGGIGGGVLFTPIVGSFFSFHLDFVRSAGLFVALTGSMVPASWILKRGLANFRLTLPLALIASVGSIVGALIGLIIPTWITQTLLGVVTLFIAALIVFSKRSEFPEVPKPDKISQKLGIYGIYHDPSLNAVFEWWIHRTLPSLFLFFMIGIVAGMLGLGTGWANVPVLNVVMGCPLKIAAGTSKFLMSITDTSAALVYLNSGSVLPLITVPSVLGIMLGSYVGIRLLARVNPKIVRVIIGAILVVAGVKSLLKGFGIWV
ncbi:MULTISPECIES: sulfite exporter TauE/SafE family protein [Archaeoglobus]|jgi:uncharacterized membrane protein YfcA|uniref:Probable membrane transporter protein n=1 Tax=Archaeoglobus fulgidus TaxID=2234 RepID=A0A101E0E1_ARCFL|nr:MULTISPECIES: sulfite exporter TauE/SafE family protein [Archaeoglobus]KUJ92845.1 MAG: hypothetical protein XD40_1962 [Archaeoglobus fulgidus]KUK06301.1 MAG: hypothetical protein XD48_1466 [Archaeoglobus fulgidus]MDI3498260.1 uncharacterized protein [Archaeoglobus sp.]MDK2865611.1 uncharacterized protein [Thermotogota bacterium]